MFVHRLTQWLTRLFTSARHVSLATPPTTIGATESVSLPVVTSWLAAARRLRPLRGVPMTTVSGLRERPVPPRLRSGLIGREQVAAGRSRPLETPPNAQPPSRGDQVAQQQFPQATPQSQPLVSQQELPAFDPALPFGEDPALHRQLVAFKQLVRLGVYNEGFRRDALPEQYARSLRPDDLTSSGDETN